MNTFETQATDFVSIEGFASTVTEAIHSRHSIREFLPTEVPEPVIYKVFGEALRAASWKNSQPWEVHIVAGAARTELSRRLIDAAKAGDSKPDTAWPAQSPADAKRRMFDLGMKIYGVAGIDRKDKEARDAFMLRNFAFFEAPVAAFITTRFDLNFYVGLDIGCYLNTVMLLARENGLGTCPQAALSAFPDVVRNSLKLTAEHKVACGISLGFPKPDSQLNRFHTPRESSEDLIHLIKTLP
ncbi:MAG: nitroreductase [Spirochaetia bacterium]|nr:nitroreductase [Spirochaetia bacterium]